MPGGWSSTKGRALSCGKEGAALAALASNNIHFVYSLLALVAITFQLTCLGGVVLTQAINWLDQYQSKKATMGYTPIAVGLIIFLIFTAIA